MKGKIIKEIGVCALTVGFIVILSTSFGIIPPLGNFLNPFGVWTVPGNAKYRDMTIIDSRLNGPVNVQFDNYGIPHIHAKTDRDLFFALGYLHAYNRLFEMDIFRRAASGRLSEILGADYINADKYFRILGFNRHAQKGEAYMQANEKYFYDLLVSYSDGVNKFIDSITPWTMPFEYKLLSLKPTRWTPFDTIVFKYLQAWDLSGDLSDLDTTLLQQYLPAKMYAELYPNATMGEPFVPPIIHEFRILENAAPSPLANSIRALEAFEENRPHIFGTPYEGAGSNNWAVNGSKSKTGNPLLAGDPHLGYQQPSLWYEVQMVSDEGYNCTGCTFPAAPVILIGHNDHVAWSLTNIGGDAHVDFYEEKLNKIGTQYYFNGSWRTLNTYTETINVKGGPSDSIIVRETIHGPLITDLVANLTGRGFANLSLKWTSTSPDLKVGGNYSNEFKGLYLMNKATDFTSFNEGLRWFGAMQNVVYADDKGNIAMTVSGPFPIRKQGVNGTADGKLKGNIVQNGTGIGEEWAGFIPFNQLPREINPSRCWVSSSNQLSINGSYPYYIGQNTFDDAYRARRIKALLTSKNDFTLTDFEAMQGDNYDYSASQFLPILISAWNYSINKEHKTYDQTVKDAMNILYGWNYIVDKNYIAPTIYEKWLEKFQANTWDEFTFFGAGSLRKPMITILENLTKFDQYSKWFDMNNTPAIESRNDTMLLSLNQTVAWLQANYGAMANWVWGNHHKIYVKHITGLRALSSPEIPLDGGPNLINNQWGTGGPSWRMVVDLGNSNSEEIYPGGQNGNPMSPHYWDLFYLYINYQYHAVYRTTISTTILEATWVFSP